MQQISINIPAGLVSDGCTMCDLCKRLFGADRYKDYCREHDFLRRYNVINWFKSNILLSRRIWKHGLIGKLRSPFYLVFTTISYPWYSTTYQLPEEWEEYANYYRYKTR